MSVRTEPETAITIPLSGETREFVEAQSAAGGYGSASEYVQALIHRERTDQARLSGLIRKGLASGASAEFTPEDWADIREQVRCGILAQDG